MLKRYQQYVVPVNTEFHEYRGLCLMSSINCATLNWIYVVRTEPAWREKHPALLLEPALSKRNSLYRIDFRNFICERWA